MIHPTTPRAFDNYRFQSVEKPQMHSIVFRSISAYLVKELVTTMTEEQFNETFLLIDCRYRYEYDGGHIPYAISYFDSTKVDDLFYTMNEEGEHLPRHSRIPIFYCEFSQVRGPKMANALRDFDRAINHYPRIDFAEIYLLDCGYRQFYELFKHENICVPNGYTQMICVTYRNEMNKYTFHKSSRRPCFRLAQHHSAVRKRHRDTPLRVNSHQGPNVAYGHHHRAVVALQGQEPVGLQTTPVFSRRMRPPLDSSMDVSDLEASLTSTGKKRKKRKSISSVKRNNSKENKENSGEADEDDEDGATDDCTLQSIAIELSFSEN